MAEDVRQIIDQFGTPIPSWQIAALREEISPVGAMRARPPFEGHLAAKMDPGRLGACLRAADNGNTHDWMIVAEEIEELFPHYSAVLGKRRRQVVQLPVVVETGDAKEEHAEFIRRWLNKDVLQRALFDVSDAIGKGYSVTEIMWDTRPGYVAPSELLYRQPRWFELSFWDASTVWLRTEQGFQELAPHKFLVHRHPSKSGNIARSGLTRLVCWMWMYAMYTQRDWAIFTQAYGLPVRLGRYGPEASERDKKVLWQAISSIAGDVSAMIPKSMELEFVEGSKGTAHSNYKDRADWLNFEVSKLVLGSTAGTDAVRGSHSAASAHVQGEQDVERFDAYLLATTITRQLVQPMIAFTFGPQQNYPVLRLGEEAGVELKDVIAGVTDLAGLGLKVKADEIREKLQLSKPEPGDETIGGVRPAPEPKPDIPRPPVMPTGPEAQQQRVWLGSLITRHAEAPPELVEQMMGRLADDARGALAGMTERIRKEFEAATDMRDLAERLHALHLPGDQFAEAMARGLALSNLVGQAALLDELRERR